MIKNAGLDEAQARIKIVRRNSNNLRYAGDTTFISESKEELESLDESVTSILVILNMFKCLVVY